MQDYISRKTDINGSIETVVVKQFDSNSRFLHVTLSDSALPEEYAKIFEMEGCAARVPVTLGHEKFAYVDGEIADAEGGIVTFLLPGSITQRVGTYLCEIRITEPTGGALISTKPFALRVEESISADGAIEATPQYSALENALMRVDRNERRVDTLAALADSGDIPAGTIESEVIDARGGFDNLGDALEACVMSQNIYLNAKKWATSPYLKDFNNLPNNAVFGCGVYNIPQNVSEADDLDGGRAKISNAPYEKGLTGTIVTFGRETERKNGDTQLFFPWHGGTLLYRQYNVTESAGSASAWSAWVTGTDTLVSDVGALQAAVADMPQHRPGINADAAAYSNRLSNFTDDGTFIAAPDKWTDIPSSETYIIQNTRYSSYILQTATSVNSGLSFNRIVGRTDHNVWRNWTPADGTDHRMKVIALGDSICSGFRNGGKGFAGDLGLPYKNIGIAGTTLSDRIDGTVDGKDRTCIPKQLLREATREATENDPAFAPDIIIASGGVNDYITGAPLGTLPTAPVMKDADLEGLDPSTVTGGLQCLFYYMVKYYPAAQRYFLITHKTKKRTPKGENDTYSDHDEYVNWSVTKNNDTENGYTFDQLHDAIAECCRVYSVRVTDVYRDRFLTTVFSQYRSPSAYDKNNPAATKTQYVDIDGVHPLSRGYLEGYVPLIKEAIRTGTVKGV